MLEFFEFVMTGLEALLYWRFFLCFFAAMVLAYLMFAAGTNAALSTAAFAGMIGVGIYWEYTTRGKSHGRKERK